MEKHAVIYVMYKGKVIGYCDDMEEVNELLTDLFNSAEGDDFSEVRLLNVVDAHALSTFPMKYEPGDVYLGDESVGDADTVLKLDNSDWSGKEFADEDDLREWLRDMVREGHMDMDDVKNLRVTREIVETISLDDAYQDSGTWRIDVDELDIVSSPLYDRMGAAFMSEADVNKHIDAMIEKKLPKAKTADEMTDEELADEITRMREATYKLERERTIRITNRA